MGIRMKVRNLSGLRLTKNICPGFSLLRVSKLLYASDRARSCRSNKKSSTVQSNFQRKAPLQLRVNQSFSSHCTDCSKCHQLMPLELSNELWLTILRLCDRSVWLRLNLVSKDLHALCLPLIYCDIDLSTHNSDIPFPPYLLTYRPDPPSIEPAEAKVRRLQKVQELFLHTVIKHPEYASLTRSLTWTLTFGPEVDETNNVVEHLIYPHNQTWQVLQTLQNVQRLDLASQHMLMRYSYVRDCPRRLFPLARSVRISGIMDEKLFKSIVSHNPDRLEQLSVDDVQHWGLHADGRPLTATGSGSIGEQLRVEAGIYPMGPMRGIFGSSGHYSRLSHLFLRKVASRCMTEVEFVPEADIAVYKEWASFINSVKCNLRTMTFEQAAPPSGWLIRRGGDGQLRRPMDQRFHDYLLPVFLEGGWDSLERLEIRGVGRKQHEDSIIMNKSTMAAIADSVGPNVKLIILEEARRPAFMWAPPGY